MRREGAIPESSVQGAERTSWVGMCDIAHASRAVLNDVGARLNANVRICERHDRRRDPDPKMRLRSAAAPSQVTDSFCRCNEHGRRGPRSADEGALNLGLTGASYPYAALLATHAIRAGGNYMRPNVEPRYTGDPRSTVTTPNAGGLVDAPACGHPEIRPLGDPAYGYWCETCGSPFAPFEVAREPGSRSRRE